MAHTLPPSPQEPLSLLADLGTSHIPLPLSPPCARLASPASTQSCQEHRCSGILHTGPWLPFWWRARDTLRGRRARCSRSSAVSERPAEAPLLLTTSSRPLPFLHPGLPREALTTRRPASHRPLQGLSTPAACCVTGRTALRHPLPRRQEEAVQSTCFLARSREPWPRGPGLCARGPPLLSGGRYVLSMAALLPGALWLLSSQIRPSLPTTFTYTV